MNNYLELIYSYFIIWRLSSDLTKTKHVRKHHTHYTNYVSKMYLDSCEMCFYEVF